MGMLVSKVTGGTGFGCLSCALCLRAMCRTRGEVIAGYETVIIDDPVIQDTLDKLSLHQVGGQLYASFIRIDLKGDGKIDVGEFFCHFAQHKSMLGERIFTMMGTIKREDLHKGGRQEVDFNCFLVSIWNFCTLDNRGLKHAIFELYDTERKGEIDQTECESLVRMLHNQKALKQKQLDAINKAVEENDTDGSGTIDFEEFCVMVDQQPELVEPAFALQLVLQQQLVGRRFWRDATKKRKRNADAANVEDVLYKQDRIAAETAKEKREKDGEDRAKRHKKRAERLKVKDARERREKKERLMQELANWRKEHSTHEFVSHRAAVREQAVREHLYDTFLRQLEETSEEKLEDATDFDVMTARERETWVQDNPDRVRMQAWAMKARQKVDQAQKIVMRIWKTREQREVGDARKEIRRALEKTIRERSDIRLRARLMQDAVNMQYTLRCVGVEDINRATAFRRACEEEVTKRQQETEDDIRKAYAEEQVWRERDARNVFREARKVAEASGEDALQEVEVLNKQESGEHWPPRPELPMDALPLDFNPAFRGCDTRAWALRQQRLDPGHAQLLKIAAANSVGGEASPPGGPPPCLSPEPSVQFAGDDASSVRTMETATDGGGAIFLPSTGVWQDWSQSDWVSESTRRTYDDTSKTQLWDEETLPSYTTYDTAGGFSRQDRSVSEDYEWWNDDDATVTSRATTAYEVD